MRIKEQETCLILQEHDDERRVSNCNYCNLRRKTGLHVTGFFFYIPNYMSFRTLLSKCEVTWFVRLYLEVSCCDVHADQLICKAPFRLCLCIFFSLKFLKYYFACRGQGSKRTRILRKFGFLWGLVLRFLSFFSKDGDLHQKHLNI